MSASDRFRFRATDVFGLFGRGLVFRGSVITGEISVGAMVAIAGRSREHQARVAAIELNRNLIETSKHGVELGLLLADFKDPMIQRILASTECHESASALPTPQDLLEIDLPVDLLAAT